MISFPDDNRATPGFEASLIADRIATRKEKRLEQNDGSRPRVLIALVGDMIQDPQTRIKYGTFLEALARQCRVVGVYNAKLRGLSRLFNALIVWHPDKNKWKERANKNVAAFMARSRNVARWAASMQGQADAIIQLGVLFDAGRGGSPLPQIIYTDYTAHLSAQQPEAGRSPLKGNAIRRWLQLEKNAMNRADHICVRSDFVRKSIVNDYQVASEKISIIGGGVNLENLPVPVERSPQKPPIALFIGSDFRRKGGDLLLKAFAQTRHRFPDARLVLLTKDSVPPSLPLDGVQVMPLTWRREEILDLYERADLFVMPSRLETWGDVFLEAMAFGLPCIGVTGQAMNEIIRHGETGYLVPPEDVPALSEALMDLFSDAGKRFEMGNAARELVHSEFTWDHVVNRLVPILRSA